MSEPWGRAVAEALDEDPATAEDVLRAELPNLWYDLGEAYEHAINGMWSMQCDGLVARIVAVSRLVGAVNWEQLPIGAMLLNGIYDGVMTSSGIPFEPVNVTELQAIAAETGHQRCPECSLWDGHHTKPCSLRPRTPYERDQERLADFAARHGI